MRLCVFSRTQTLPGRLDLHLQAGSRADAVLSWLSKRKFGSLWFLHICAETSFHLSNCVSCVVCSCVWRASEERIHFERYAIKNNPMKDKNIVYKVVIASRDLELKPPRLDEMLQNKVYHWNSCPSGRPFSWKVLLKSDTGP